MLEASKVASDHACEFSLPYAYCIATFKLNTHNLPIKVLAHPAQVYEQAQKAFFKKERKRV